MKKYMIEIFKNSAKQIATMLITISFVGGAVLAGVKNNGDILMASDWNDLISSVTGIDIKTVDKYKLIESGCEDTITLGTQVWCAQDSKLKHDFLLPIGSYFYKGINKAKACPTGFHVPTNAEWNTAIVNSGSNHDTLATNLGLHRYAGAGIDDHRYQWNGNYGAYWNNEYGYILLLRHSLNYPLDHNIHSAMVRCLKN